MNLQNELGKRRSLMVVKIVDFGVYLGTKDEKVLLPKKEVPAGIEVGDPIEVFLYKDSSDRIIATTRIPKLMMGEVKVLEVADTARIGAFWTGVWKKISCFRSASRQQKSPRKTKY